MSSKTSHLITVHLNFGAIWPVRSTLEDILCLISRQPYKDIDGPPITWTPPITFRMFICVVASFNLLTICLQALSRERY